MSYVNLIMYGAVLPSYKHGNKEGKDDEIINADDPKNHERIREFFAGID